MPIEMLALAAFLLGITSLIVLIEGEVDAAKYLLPSFLGCILWIILSATRPIIIDKTVEHPIHTSPDGYQYSTLIDGKMKNVTKEFGKTFDSNMVLREEVPYPYYMGVNLEYNNIYKVVTQRETEEK